MKRYIARRYFFAAAGAAALLVCGKGTAAAQANPIQIENAKAGSSDWQLTRVARHDDEIYERGWHRRKGIEAYASRTSVKAGDTLDVHVSTYPVNKYSANIYRMGYYGGAGARLVRSLGPLQGTAEPDAGRWRPISGRMQMEGGLQPRHSLRTG